MQLRKHIDVFTNVKLLGAPFFIKTALKSSEFHNPNTLPGGPETLNLRGKLFVNPKPNFGPLILLKS